MNKNKAFKKKLTFKKQTIANIDGHTMNRVYAGVAATGDLCTGYPCDTIHYGTCLPHVIAVTFEPTCPASCLPPCPSEEPGCLPPSEVESCYPCATTIV